MKDAAMREAFCLTLTKRKKQHKRLIIRAKQPEEFGLFKDEINRVTLPLMIRNKRKSGRNTGMFCITEQMIEETPQ